MNILKCTGINKIGLTENIEKRIIIIKGGISHTNACDESKSGNITDFVDSLCFKSSFSTDTWKLYDHFQHFTYRTADPDPEEKF